MNITIKIATLAAIGASLLGAGTASAYGPGDAVPQLDVVIEGPQGAVWSGTCPAGVFEADVDTLSPMCRSLGFSTGARYVAAIRDAGGTKVTRSLNGQLARTTEITPEGRFLTTRYPGVWDWSTPEFPSATFTKIDDCELVAGGTDIGDACVHNFALPGQATARAARNRAAKPRAAKARAAKERAAKAAATRRRA